MDIKLKNCSTERDYKYLWGAVMVLALSGIMAASGELSYASSSPALLLWIMIYACGAVVIVSGIELFKRLGAKKEEIFIDHFDKWQLETPIIIFLVFNFFANIFIVHGWMAGIIFGSGENLNMSFQFLLTTLNLTLLSIPVMTVNVGLFMIALRHFKIPELRENNRTCTLIPKLKERFERDKSLYRENYDFQKERKKKTRFYIISLLVFMVVLLCFLGSTEFMMYTGTFGMLLTVLILILCTMEVIHCFSRRKFLGFTAKVLDAVAVIEAGRPYQPDGTLEYDPAFAEASSQLVSIQKQLQMSVSEQKKSERMKVDLITNVSHDLKTPLTSIISYIDLLQKEEGLSEEANDYLKILAQKSDRLKDMVQDLFEISKATSGTIELELECLNMKKLLEQTLGDMDDRIQASGLTIKKNFCKEDAYFLGDGKRLYRVYQNLIENALKYSLSGTRIYIDLTVSCQKVTTVIKNVAGYEMDFSDNDITERFTRGDKARSSEGNGLGLSIAKSFTEMCYGMLDIEIDGDLFKVIVAFPESLET